MLERFWISFLTKITYVQRCSQVEILLCTWKLHMEWSNVEWQHVYQPDWDCQCPKSVWCTLHHSRYLPGNSPHTCTTEQTSLGHIISHSFVNCKMQITDFSHSFICQLTTVAHGESQQQQQRCTVLCVHVWTHCMTRGSSWKTKGLFIIAAIAWCLARDLSTRPWSPGTLFSFSCSTAHFPTAERRRMDIQQRSSPFSESWLTLLWLMRTFYLLCVCGCWVSEIEPALV